MHGGRECVISIYLSIYLSIYIYMCWTVAKGTAFLQKTGRFGVHLKAGLGTAPFRTIKIGIQRKSVATARKAKNHKFPPPPGPRALNL